MPGVMAGRSIVSPVPVGQLGATARFDTRSAAGFGQRSAAWMGTRSAAGGFGQRGAAALIVTMLLFFAMVLAAVFVNRNLVFEQRSSSNQYRSTQAFEAAEAGLEWALAQLNEGRRVGADCEPSSDATATSFRERYLGYQRSNATFSGITWAQGGNATPLQPACVRGAGGWSCSCPTASASVLAAPAGVATAPTFNVTFSAGPKAGLVRVVATGCSKLAAPCVAGASVGAEASARLEVLLGLVPGLRTPPVAALTTRGSVHAGTAALGAHNADPATGVALHAGAAIDAPQARVTAPAGAPPFPARVANDATLAALGPERLFAAYFGLPKAAWKAQPAVKRIHCSDDCSADLQAAIGDDLAQPLVWIDGDTDLNGPLVIGSPERPVIVVVDGQLRLGGTVRLHGLAYAAGVTWNGAPGGFVRGALISEGDHAGGAAPDVVYDTAVLAALRGNTGSFARVNGSWRDFQ